VPPRTGAQANAGTPGQKPKPAIPASAAAQAKIGDVKPKPLARAAVLIDASGDRTYRDEIEDTFLLLEENFDTLYQRCSTSEQKRHLCDTYSAARYACWKVARPARPYERSVDSRAFQDLKMANMQLGAMLQNLDDIGAFLSLAAGAVRLATSLAPPSADA